MVFPERHPVVHTTDDCIKNSNGREIPIFRASEADKHYKFISTIMNALHTSENHPKCC